MKMPDWKLMCMEQRSFGNWEGINSEEQVGKWQDDGKLVCKRVRGLSSPKSTKTAEDPWRLSHSEVGTDSTKRTLKPVASLPPRASCLYLMTHSLGQDQLLASSHKRCCGRALFCTGRCCHIQITPPPHTHTH